MWYYSWKRPTSKLFECSVYYLDILLCSQSVSCFATISRANKRCSCVQTMFGYPMANDAWVSNRRTNERTITIALLSPILASQSPIASKPSLTEQSDNRTNERSNDGSQRTNRHHPSPPPSSKPPLTIQGVSVVSVYSLTFDCHFCHAHDCLFS